MIQDSKIAKSSISNQFGVVALRNVVLSDSQIRTVSSGIWSVSSQLENSKLQAEAGEIHIEDSRFTGNNEVKTQAGDIQLNLKPKTLEELDLTAETKLGEIQDREQELENAHIYALKGKNPTSKLKVTSTSGDISIKEAY